MHPDHARQTPSAIGPPDSLPLSAPTRLLLACCRARPDPGEISRLLHRIGDPEAIVPMARHHLILPLVYFRLGALPDGADIARKLPGLAAENRKAALHNLLQQAELDHLVRVHLVPRGIGYLTVKGLSLAARYYPDIALRQARDIDLLVAPGHLHELTSGLVGHGYRLLQADLVRSPADLLAYCKMNYEINLVSPRGIPVQLHQQLDFSGCQIPVPARQLIERAEHFRDGGREFPVLPTSDLFIYIAQHHGRHQWSRLHWLADLDAMLAHPDMDLAGMRARADQLGLRPVVEAALSLHAVLFGGAGPDTVRDKFSRITIRDCLHFLSEGVLPPERRRVEDRKTGAGIARAWLREFGYNWRSNTRTGNRLRYLYSITRPTYADYLFLPLPPALHGLYRAMRPLRWCVEILRGKPTGLG